jgi:hypothetical protein
MSIKLLAPADLPSEKEPQVSTEADLGLHAVSMQSSGAQKKSGNARQPSNSGAMAVTLPDHQFVNVKFSRFLTNILQRGHGGRGELAKSVKQL